MRDPAQCYHVLIKFNQSSPTQKRELTLQMHIIVLCWLLIMNTVVFVGAKSVILDCGMLPTVPQVVVCFYTCKC